MLAISQSAFKTLTNQFALFFSYFLIYAGSMSYLTIAEKFSRYEKPFFLMKN